MARHADYRLRDFRLDDPYSRKRDVVLYDSITAAEVELTMEGASVLTVTVEDPHKRLLRSDTLSRWTWGDNPGDEDSWVRRGRALDAKLDDLDFRLVKVAKSGTTLTLTFEDRAVAYLRQHRGALRASRTHMTRAEFVRRMVKEVKAHGGIPFFCPELHERQKVAKSRETGAKRDTVGGLDRTGLKVKDAAGNRYPLREGQARICERILAVAEALDAPTRATLAMVEAAMVENEFSNSGVINDPGSTSVGVFQAQYGLSAGPKGTITREQALDVEYMARAFLTGPGFASKGSAIELARKHPDWSAGQIAQAVEASAYPDRYDKVHDEALAIVRAYRGGGGSPNLETTRKATTFTRGKDETSWDAIHRLADEVNWHAFMRLGTLCYVSDEYLFRQRAQMRLVEGEQGVDVMDFDVDMGARLPVAEVNVTARADRWIARPGMVVSVRECGPADGRWLVSSIRRDLLDPSGSAEIVLRKPIPKKAEPADTVTTKALSDGKASDALTEAKRISAQNRAYVYGGGHGGSLSSIGPHDGLDCSSSCSLALKRAGMFPGSSAIVSGDFAASWGKPGKGEHMTVWANAEHVWIEWPKLGVRFDTSPHGDGPSGPHVRHSRRSTAGFTPRHWPGT